jgi:hypothetical protein
MNAQLAKLAKYQVGDTGYRVELVPRRRYRELGEDDLWMVNCHPKAQYHSGNRPWRCSQSPPRVGSMDFAVLMCLLTTRMKVAPYTIEQLERCLDTGDFIYRQQREWLPEPCLMATVQEAMAERDRLLKLVELWRADEL